MSDAGIVEDFVERVVQLIVRHAAEPEMRERLRDAPPMRVLVAIFERDAALTGRSVEGEWVRLPNLERTQGQQIFAYIVTVGEGRFRAERVDRSRIPDDLASVVYVSAPTLAALVMGRVETPSGPVPFTGLDAFKSGLIDFVGLDGAAAFALLGTLTGAIARARAELGSAEPTAAAPPPNPSSEPKKPTLLVPGSWWPRPPEAGGA